VISWKFWTNPGVELGGSWTNPDGTREYQKSQFSAGFKALVTALKGVFLTLSRR
jgi:hypothetical protein